MPQIIHINQKIRKQLDIKEGEMIFIIKKNPEGTKIFLERNNNTENKIFEIKQIFAFRETKSLVQAGKPLIKYLRFKINYNNKLEMKLGSINEQDKNLIGVIE